MTSLPTLDQVRHALQRLHDSSSSSSSSSSSRNPREEVAPLVAVLRPILLCGEEDGKKDEAADAAATAHKLELVDALAADVVALFSSSTSPLSPQLRSSQALESFVNARWQLSFLVNTEAADAAAAGKGESSSSSSSTSSSSMMFVTFLRLLREHASARAMKPASPPQMLMLLPMNLTALLVGCLPAGLLEGSGWIRSEADLAKRLRLFNTSQYYKQHRFHLLAEESQGYAKFLNVLVRLSAAATAAATTVQGRESDALVQGLRSIAGIFSLDPNRCVDLALNVMAWNLANSTLAAASATARATTAATATTTTSTTEWMRVRDALDPFLPVFRPSATQPPALLTAHLPALLAFSMSDKDGEAPAVHAAPAAHAANSKAELSGVVPEHRHLVLNIMVWLVHRELLDVSAMLEYMPQTVDVAGAYHELHQTHAASIRQQGRVRLAVAAAGQDATAASTHVLESDLTRQLANEGLVRWIRAFVSLDQFSLIRRSFDDSFWRHLCYLFPADLGVPILEQTLEPILDAAAVSGSASALLSSMLLPPWSSPTEVKEQQANSRGARHGGDDPGGDATPDLTTIRDVLGLVFESGCLRHVPVLYARLCRYATAAVDNLLVASQQREDVMEVVVDIIGCLLPSSSLFDQNPSMSHAAWAMIDQLPYSTRYGLYQEWRDEGRPLWLMDGEARALKAARYVLKRLSHDTIRDQSRALAKICHSHPLVVFTTILGQIESYDNLVSVMVEALRFVTPLSLDVLAFCILSRLGEKQPQGGGVNRSRLKEDGVNLSQWLQSLESFVGAFYRRFPQVDCTGLLSYLQHRLKDGHVMEIGLLRTLLKTSAGWAFCDYSPAASLSSSQLEGLSGSALLRRETMTFGVVEAMDPRASERLRQVLQNHDAGVTLLILLAQARHTIIFGSAKGGDSTKSKPVKLVAHLVDSCQVLMAVLLDFLTDPAESRGSKSTNDGYDATSPRMRALEVYASSLPTLQDLFCRYRVDYASSWMMCRPLIRASTWKQLEADAAQDIPSSPADLSKVAPAATWMDAFMTGEESHKLYKEMLPTSAWSHVTTDLFGTFFTYALFDVMCPEETYSTEIARLEKQAERLAQAKPATSVAQSTQFGASSPKNDEEELHRVKKVTSRLINDQKKQRSHVAAARKRIASNKASFFVSGSVTKEGALEFLSHCVYKRCMQGPDEAMYCAAFISMLHEEGTPGFGTLHLIDTLIVALTRSLFGITEGEAANVSILLHEVWKLVSKWRYDEDAFEMEVAGKPGSCMVSLEGAEADPAPINHSDFCGLYNKWHAVIGATAIGCLESLQYIHIRNCLIVLTRLVETYPTRPGLANKLVETLEPLQDESNPFADIRASALAYSKQLLRARDDGVWKEESAAAVRARKEREESVAAARQEQAKLLMAEISREAEQISERIGESEIRGRGGDRRRMDAPSAAPPPPRSGRSALSTSPPPPQTNPPTSRETSRDDRRSLNQRLSDPTPSAGAAGSYTAILSAPGSGPRDEASTRSSLDGRWRERDRVGGDRLSSRDRGAGDSRERESKERGSGNDRKRSRPSSPVEEGETTAEESRSQKRARSDDVDAEDVGGGRRRKGGGRFRRS